MRFVAQKVYYYYYYYNKLKEELKMATVNGFI